MEKSYIILDMYDKLCAGEGLKIDECLSQYGISVPTFRRYIAFLRFYFAQKKGKDIVYKSKTAEYKLK